MSPLPPRLVALSVAALAATAQPQAPTATQLDAIFARWNRSTPGCAVGVSKNGATIARGAYGMADLEHDVAVAPDTIFEAGSVSKQFTAAAVLLLARDGKLSLDDPVRRHIPELPESGAPVTIRQMLHHTSGLRDWGSLAAIAGWPRTSRVHTHAHVLDIVGRQRALNFAPGTRWSYSNSNYNLAAIMVARVSGMSLAAFTKARLFEPLGMRDTSWRDDHTRIVKRRAIAYSERQGEFAIDMPFENVHGNAALLTTVEDLLKWNENFVQPRVGDAAFVAEMQRRARFDDGREHEYALGVYVDTFRGVAEVDHSGATAGYRAHLSRYPDHHLSVAVLCNAASANATGYAKTIAELYLGRAMREAAPPAATYTPTDADMARIAGLYRSLHPVVVSSIVRDKDGLRMERVGRLVPLSAARFAIDGGWTMEVDRRAMRMTDEFGTVSTYDRVDATAPKPEQLKALVGSYESDEVETTLTVALEDETLVIRRRPDTRIALTPVSADTFSGALGWIVFHRDASGRVVSLSLSQERVWDLRFARRPSS
jgi:CubicO group peptidase (beta-lactamase class C family)